MHDRLGASKRTRTESFRCCLRFGERQAARATLLCTGVDSSGACLNAIRQSCGGRWTTAAERSIAGRASQATASEFGKPAVNVGMGFGLVVGCAEAERRRSGGMLGTKPQWSVARQGPDGSPAPMRAPTAVTSARSARRAGPKRSQRRPGRRPKRALVTALQTRMVERRAGRMALGAEWFSVACSVASSEVDSAWLGAWFLVRSSCSSISSCRRDNS